MSTKTIACHVKETYETGISIIIPVYNVEMYLSKCLDSLLNQTFDNIEIVCIDDASTDSSLSILLKYAQNNNRIQVIQFDENKSACQARIAGVEASKGKYIMFVDADDTLELNSCEFLYNKMEESDTDIIHFGTNIINRGNLPQARIKSMEKFVEPFKGKFIDEQVFSACFKEQKYQFSLWNKIYKSSLVKKAFKHLEKISLPKAQDKYAYWAIAFFAKSYMGISEKFYNYNFGTGVTGHNVINLETFYRYCTMGDTSKAMKRFLEKVGAYEKYEQIYFKAHQQLFNDCFANWNNLNKNDYGEGFEMMVSHFEKSEVVSALAKKYWWNYNDAVSMINTAPSMCIEPKEIKTIAAYYHKLECGGVQMVLVKLAEYWVELGYKVIVLTDCPPCDGDYDLPEGVEQIVLPSYFEITKDNIIERCRVIDNILKEYNVDALVYHAWVSSIILWDLLMCKLNNVRFIIHCHSIFSMPLRNSRVFFGNIPYVYSLADSVVTLSECDSDYWGNFNNNIVQVVNPVRYNDLSLVSTSSLTNNNIIWCARFSDEKRPLDAIEIFRLVHDEIPSAKLFMLGKGTDNSILNNIKKKITEYHLDDAVILFGYQKDVRIYYEMSSINLMTSEYEGFPLGLLESMSAGVPTVMYELPYLELVKDNEGIISIPNRSIKEAANEIIELLKNNELLLQMGLASRKKAEDVVSFQYKKIWNDLFMNLSTEKISIRQISTQWETFFNHYKEGVVSLSKQLQELRSKISEQNEIISAYDKKKMLNLDELTKKNKELQDELINLKKKLEETNKSLQTANKSNAVLNKTIAEKENDITIRNYELTEIRKSVSYKLAMFFTWLPRKIRRIKK